MQSQKYTLNKEDGAKILSVIGWSVASAVVASLIFITQDISVPTEYAFVLPIVNTVLYALSKFIAERS